MKLHDLILRPLAASDQKLVCDLYQDREMMQMIGTAFSHKQALQLFNKALKAIEKNKAWYFIVESQSANKDLAFVGMQLQLLEPKSLEVGTMILKPYRSQGIAAWVQQQAFKMGASKHGIFSYVVYCAANHQAANNSYSRMGFNLIINKSTKKHHLNMNCWHFKLSDLSNDVKVKLNI